MTCYCRIHALTRISMYRILEEEKINVLFYSILFKIEPCRIPCSSVEGGRCPVSSSPHRWWAPPRLNKHNFVTLFAREGMHSPFFWRRNPTKTLGFLLPWFSPWFFVDFLLSPPPYAQSFLRKPSFLVLADFFPWFFESKQLLGFLGVVYMLQ